MIKQIHKFAFNNENIDNISNENIRKNRYLT